MGVVTIWSERHIDLAPDVLFATFAQDSEAGWLFGGTCDNVATGSVITLHLPIDGAECVPVELLGRIRTLTPPSRIEIVHHQPWEGRLLIRLDRDVQGGTRVRLIGEVDESSLEWLMRRRGYPFVEADAAEFRVGLLTSKSGPASVFAEATEYVARMAVEEINQAGGIREQLMQIVVGDDATDPVVGACEAQRLAHSGCSAILVTTTSATFTHAARQLRGSGVPLIHTPMNEGGSGESDCIQLGERPAAQLLAAGPMMQRTGSRRWYLAGNDYIWPRSVHQAARGILPDHCGEIVGEAYAPLGTRDFSAIVDKIKVSGADTILSSFVGADLVAFERQCFEAGLRNRCRSLALALDEPTRERIGDTAALGTVGIARFFPEDGTSANADFAERYRNRFGDFAPSLSSISHSVYEAIYLVARAARAEHECDTAHLLRSIRTELATTPTRTLRPECPQPGEMHRELYLAESAVGGFDVTRVAAAG